MEPNSQKHSPIIIIIAIIVMAAIGYFFIKQKDTAPSHDAADHTATHTEQSPVEAAINNILPQSSGPKDIFLARNTAMIEAKSANELLSVSQKYDTEELMAKGQAVLKNATAEQKDQYVLLARSYLTPTAELQDITEEINGDSATVTATISKGNRMKATLVRVNGSWRVDSVKKLVTPS